MDLCRPRIEDIRQFRLILGKAAGRVVKVTCFVADAGTFPVAGET